jgi:hypothetical protein
MAQPSTMEQARHRCRRSSLPSPVMTAKSCVTGWGQVPFRWRPAQDGTFRAGSTCL